MPTPDDEGHLSADNPPKLPLDHEAWQLNADAVEFADGNVSEESFTSKVPSHCEKGIFGHDDRACIATGGSHIYDMQRTADGRRVCTECQEPAAGEGA